MSQKTATPWLSSYGNLPHTLNYSEKSMSAAVLDTAAREKDFIALSFNGRKIPFAEMAVNIERTAKAFYHMGVRPGNRVLVCLPNVPQAIYFLYAWQENWRVFGRRLITRTLINTTCYGTF